MTDQLDTLLSQPLRDVPDNGFTNRVAAQMELARLRRDRLVTDICAGLVLLCVLVLPFTAIGRLFAVTISTPLGMALTGIVLAAIVGALSVRKPGLMAI